MDCKVRWTGDGMSFLAESGSGHLVAMDGSPDGGGRNLAARPMELVLIGAAGCTAYDVVLILKRGRHEIRACDVEVHAERAASDPKVFTEIRLRYRIRGRALDPAAVDRAVALSHEKYCSATAMLSKTATIHHEIVVELD
ncbi:MAG TPA: OsmC family protein [Burkholderiaceae bacterium]|nr:OsmC family protein [Burkholderiaceae bacterium]